MTLHELMNHCIQQIHIYPERAEWPVCVGIIESGGFQEFTVLVGVHPEPDLKAYFVNALPQSAL